MARKRSVQPRQNSTERISRGFLLLFILLLVPSVALWFFYRSLFEPEASLAGLVFLSPVMAWFWAYLLGFGKDLPKGD